MDGESSSVIRSRRVSEAVVLGMVCLAPWAFGSVEAWAELALDVGIAVVAVLGVIAGRGSDRRRNLLGTPSLALAGLALLALAQSVPLPDGVLGSIAGRADLASAESETVAGDLNPPVAPPPRTVSAAPEESINTAARLAAAWVLFQVVLGLRGGDPALRRFTQVTAANAALMALFSIVQSLTWTGKIFWFRASPIADGWKSGGPFIGHNPLAAYLNLGLGASLGLLLASGRESRRPGARAWAAYAVGMTAVGVVASHSRSGFLAMLVAGALFARLLRSGGGRSRGVLALTAGGVVLFLSVLGISSSYQRLATIFESSAYDDRLEIWGAAARAWTARPIWGSGFGSFAVAAAPSFRLDHGVVFGRAENEYLDVLLEGGLVGVGLGLAGLISVFRRGLLALEAAPSRRESALIAGGLFGVAALAVQSAGDFSPHIAGVAITAVVACAHLCGLGQDARCPRGPVPRGGRWRSPLIGSGIAALSLAILGHASHLARAEARLAGSGVPSPGLGMPAAIPADVPKSDLERMRVALERALNDRPNWAEGHLRLGMTLLSLYRCAASESIVEELGDREAASRLSDPLWLHAAAHSGSAGVGGPPVEYLGHEPIRLYLAPAARCFLEARRCCPTLAAPHAYLASLDFLLERGGPGRAHAARALRLAGADSRVIALIAQVSVQSGDPELAARGWRKALEVRESNWESVADDAGAALPPEQILDRVLPPGGRLAIEFADRIYADPKGRDARVRFLKAALRRLEDDPGLPPAERLRLEARARAGLDEPDRARDLWTEALALEPLRDEWRLEFASWLAGRGEVEAAHRQAVVGLRLHPNHSGLREALEATAVALARDPGHP